MSLINNFRKLGCITVKLLTALSTIVGLTIILIIPMIATAKTDTTTKKTRNFLLSTSGIYYLNQGGVSQFEGTKKYLISENTYGYQVSIGYELVNRRGITFTPEIGYGNQRQFLDWNVRMTDLDSSFPPDTYYSYSFKSNTRYFIFSFSAGYNYYIGKKTKLQLKTGIGTLKRLNIEEDGKNHFIAYQENGVTYSKHFLFTDAMAGSPSRWHNFYAPFYKIYIGLSHPAKSKYVEDYRIGLTYTSGIQKKDSGMDFSRSWYYNSSGQVDGIELYYNKFKSISATFTVSF